MASHNPFELPAAIVKLYPELDTLDNEATKQAALCVYSLNRTLQHAWQSSQALPGRTHSWLPQILDIIVSNIEALRTTPAASTLRQFLRAEAILCAENTYQAQLRIGQ